MLKSFLLFAAVVLLVLASASAPARSPQDATAPSAKSGAKQSPEAHSKAKKIFEQDCALCHNSTGDGKTDLAKDMQLNLLDWTDPKTLSTMSDQALFDAIRKGKGKMPPEDEGRASNESVHNLVLYIRKMAKDQSTTTAAPATANPTTPPATEPAPATAPATPATPPPAPAPSR